MRMVARVFILLTWPVHGFSVQYFSEPKHSSSYDVLQHSKNSFHTACHCYSGLNRVGSQRRGTPYTPLKAFALLVAFIRSPSVAWHVTGVGHGNMRKKGKQRIVSLPGIIGQRHCSAVLMQSKILTSGNSIVRLKAQAVTSANLPSGSSRAQLLEYLAGGEQIVPALPVPAGATCTPKPGGSPGEFLVKLPKMQFFDVSLQPVSDMKVILEKTGALLFSSDQARLTGSHHVESLGLNDRYACRIEVRFAPAKSGMQLEGTADLRVDADLPPPFSFMPREPQADVGSAVLTASLQFLMREFVPTIAKDFERWRAQQPASA